MMASDREVNMLNLFLPFLFDQRLETVKSAFLDQFNNASRSGVRIPSVLCDKQFCYQLNYDIYCFVQLSWLQLGNNIEMQLLADAAAEEQNWKLTANREASKVAEDNFPELIFINFIPSNHLIFLNRFPSSFMLKLIKMCLCASNRIRYFIYFLTFLIKVDSFCRRARLWLLLTPPLCHESQHWTKLVQASESFSSVHLFNKVCPIWKENVSPWIFRLWSEI